MLELGTSVALGRNGHRHPFRLVAVRRPCAPVAFRLTRAPEYAFAFTATPPADGRELSIPVKARAAELAAVHRALGGVRGLLALLVVFGHASRPFLSATPSPDDAVWVRVLSAMATALEAVRMPAFFTLAGMLAWRSLQKMDGDTYVNRRLLRLGVPMLVVMVLLNPMEVWVRLNYAASLGRSDASDLPTALLPGLLDGTAVLHLWFLEVLLVVSVFTPRLAAGIGRMSVRAKLVLLGVVVFGGAGVQLVAWHLDAALSTSAAGAWISPYQLLLALRFMTVGLVIASDESVLLWLMAHVRLALAAGVLALALIAMPAAGAGAAVVLWRALGRAMLPLPCIVLLTHLFRALPTWRQRFALVDASGYTLYLLHHGLAITVAVISKRWLGETFIAFLLTFLVAGTLPLVLDMHVFRRRPILALLFNGVRLQPARAGSPTTPRAPPSAPMAAEAVPALAA